jgi:hypothetical protein
MVMKTWSETQLQLLQYTATFNIISYIQMAVSVVNFLVPSLDGFQKLHKGHHQLNKYSVFQKEFL